MARVAAEDQLLFGLLALQLGLISQEDLLDAFRDWILDKSQSLADLLVLQGRLDQAERSAIDLLVARQIDRNGYDKGNSLSLISTHPSVVQALEELGDPDLDATIGHPDLASTQVGMNSSDTFGSRSTSSVGPRFQILRPHARGGLGAVYVALDAELDREVALKQILEDQADDDLSRQRFLVEAKVTGGLEHPGIVPVYGLGAYDDGRPYYAMRFIRGDSLKQAIRQFHEQPALHQDPGLRSLEMRKLLRRFLDVCNAIHYAHSRGVLHRDIKPSNIILGKYGETLVVDWGLAKATGKVDPQTEEPGLVPVTPGGSSETQPGSAMGTPPYMSPEQASGDLERLGPRSDVYSLGATLYHILCNRPPFESDDPGEVIRGVIRGDFPRPRQLQPAIDPPLEAVCVKAMALGPQDRYHSARALAEDLERWMADEPIVAYQEPRSRKLARWARRNAALAAGAGALMLTTVVALAGVIWLVSRQNSSLEKARGEIARQRERAEIGGAMARRAVAEMLDQVARNDLLNVPAAEPLRVKLAERAVAFYREFDKHIPDDPAVRYELARIEEQVGSLYRMIGDYERAMNEYAVAVRILLDLIAKLPRELMYPDLLAHTESQIGEMIKQRGGSDDEAEPHYREAVRMAARLHEARPDYPEYASLAARTHNDLANMLGMAGRHEEAEPLARIAVDSARVFRSSIDGRPNPKNFEMKWLILPLTLSTHGSSLSGLNRNDEASALLGEAVEVLRELRTNYPESNDLRFLLADALKEQSCPLGRDPARLHQAIACLDEAIKLINPLLTQFPSVVVYPRYIIVYRTERGALLLEAGLLDQANDDLSYAHERLARRIEGEKNSLEPVQQQGKVAGHLARLAARRGRLDHARALIVEAIRHQERALKIDPSSRVDKKLLESHLAFREKLQGEMPAKKRAGG